jgi:hypothetical protein
MENAIMAFLFLSLALAPEISRAGFDRRSASQTQDLKTCLRLIEKNWLGPKGALLSLRGSTRVETNCSLEMDLTPERLQVIAWGDPQSIQFRLAPSTATQTRDLQTCRVDREKIHVVFEEKTSLDFEKRERVQMTLLKRPKKGISLILSKRENKIWRPLQQSSLICHFAD